VTWARIDEMSRLVVRDGKSKQRLSQAKIKALKKKLHNAILSGHTLREMASSPHFYNNAVSFQTLGRFAKEKNYVPASMEICRALDIIADVNPYRNLPNWYYRIPEALEFWNRKREQIKEMSVNTKRMTRTIK
jgi:hypothetical protein